MVVLPEVLPCELEAPDVMVPTDPPAPPIPPAPPADVELEDPVLRSPTVELEGPVVRLPTLDVDAPVVDTELLSGLLVTAPPVVVAEVLTVICA